MLLTALIAFVLLQGYTALLIVLRAKLFGTRLYRPMLWNLFLSLVPLLLQFLLLAFELGATALFARIDAGPLAVRAAQLVGIAGFILWALVFPNASYLITELNFSHVREGEDVPEYYDIIMVFTLASTGFINALASLTVFQFMLLIIWDPPANVVPAVTWAIVVLYALSSGFAIYLGRHMRVNSWDVLHPFQFTKRLWDHFRAREHRRTAMGYTIFFSGTLIVAHVMFFNLIYSAIVNTR